MALSCIVFEIKRHVGRKLRFFSYPTCFLCSHYGGPRRNFATIFRMENLSGGDTMSWKRFEKWRFYNCLYSYSKNWLICLLSYCGSFYRVRYCITQLHGVNSECFCRAALAVMRCPSVSVSVRHLRGFCRNDKPYLQHFAPSGSHTTLVFPYQTSWQYSDGDLPNRGIECKGYKKSQFSTNISLYLGIDARATVGRRIENRTQAFEWHQF